MSPTNLGGFEPGDAVRVKDTTTLDGGKHNGQHGTVDRLGVWYVYVDLPTSEKPVPFTEDEIEAVPNSLTPEPGPSQPFYETLRERARDLNEEADIEEADIAAQLASIEFRRKEIARKRTLASQYWAVAADLEAQQP